METEKKLCLNCGKPIQGRIDKKFCDDYCRNTYNNQQNALTNNLIRNINHTLKKNRNILEAIIPSDEEMAKTTRDRLTREGFNFKFFTHTYHTKKGSLYHYCYDFGYLELEGDWFLVVKGKEI
jgi:predicted nucleic acid-binding Zn ribbon protein